MIRLTRPLLEGVLEDIEHILEGGFLVQGELVSAFEGSLAEYVSRKHAIAVNSGTSAIQCALMALEPGSEDEIVVPDFTFPATANAIVNAGGKPVLADIDLETFNVSVDSIEGLIGPRTKAVMVVDLFGLSADLTRISDICKTRGIELLEDAACALGASIDGKRCGSFGKASMLSFHPRKIVTTGEGGMVLTDDDAIADLVRKLRNHGIARGQGFVLPGFNFRMNEIEACLGLAQMRQIDRLIDGRRKAAQCYRELLADVSEVRLPSEPDGMFHTYQSYVILLDPKIDRDHLMEEMYRQGVETTIGTYAIHAQPYYRERFGYKPGMVETSYYAYQHSLALPMYSSITRDEIATVVEKLKYCLTRSRSSK